MIKSIRSSSPYLMVNTSSVPPYIAPTYGAHQNPAYGMTRYNEQTSTMEIYDGNYWLELESSQEITMTPEANAILQWAKQKMEEEMKLKANLEKYPALKKAYDNYILVQQMVENYDGEIL